MLALKTPSSRTTPVKNIVFHRLVHGWSGEGGGTNSFTTQRQNTPLAGSTKSRETNHQPGLPGLRTAFARPIRIANAERDFDS